MPIAGTRTALLAGDDISTHAMLRILLAEEQCDVREAITLETVASTARLPAFALVLLVLDSAAADVSATLARLRWLAQRAPILVLARGVTMAMRRDAFAMGAVDVVTLPASPRDLRARLRAALDDRAAWDWLAGAQPISAGGLTLDLQTRDVRDEAGWVVRLTRREATILGALMRQPGQPVARHDLLAGAWDEATIGRAGALQVYVRGLRHKLVRPQAPHGYVRTVRRRGYAFDARVTPRTRDGS